MYVICSPVGPYYKNGFKPIRLLANAADVRAWPGGVGNAKLGGNYAPTIAPAAEANKQGFEQILWLFGEDRQVTEVGAMNIFFVLKKPEGGLELVTAPLERGDILPGVTRRSIIELCRNWTKNDPAHKDTIVTERFVTMAELQKAEKEGRLMEAFGAGTAVVIAPVKGIMFEGMEIIVPTGDDIGPFAQRVWTEVTDIQYGRKTHPSWSVVL
jgi:branched-chain amino acid aminotransferase